ncbi:MAG: hypothetical protein ABII96_03150 [Candidatus Zixiibacteriota bacterium]
MEKRTIIGLVVIGLIIIFYPVYMEWITGGKKAPVTPPPAVSEVDTTGKLTPPEQELKEISPAEVASKTSSLIPVDTLSEEKTVKVETDLYSAEFPPKGRF